MSLRRRVMWTAVRLERVADALRRRSAPLDPVIESHGGFATPGGWIARGRVLADRHAPPAGRLSLVARIAAMGRLFLTREVAGVRVVTADGCAGAITDEEGYFTLRAPPGPVQDGWGSVAVRVSGAPRQETIPIRVRVAGPAARRIVISDIDDTLMRTGASSLWRNLWTTFTGGVDTREVFADAVALMQVLGAGGRDPVFYVSSSPWNLHGFLTAVFARSGLPEGPMFLRDYGIGEDQLVTGTHGNHKGQAIDTLLAAHPSLSAVLIGDTGQKDAQIYAAAAARHPGRIERVILREAGGPMLAAALDRFAALAVPVDAVRDYRGLVRQLDPGG